MSMNRDNVTASSMYKTELCRNYMKRGSCKYGIDCVFAHGSVDQRKYRLDGQKTFSDGKTVKNWNGVNELTYTKGFCRYFFTKKECPYGEKCSFVHQELEKSGEIRDETSESCVINIQTDDFGSETKPWLKTRLCKKWMMLDGCSYGADCIYAHGYAELRSPSAIQSESRVTGIPPRLSKKAEPLPYNAMEQTDVQKAPQTMCLFKWKSTKKIVGVYADWIDEESPMHLPAREQVL